LERLALDHGSDITAVWWWGSEGMDTAVDEPRCMNSSAAKFNMRGRPCINELCRHLW
jgi:hypothetical protein